MSEGRERHTGSRAGDNTVARAVLWDLDGTLVDSADQHWQAWHDTLAAEGITITFEQFRRTFGQRNDAILATWLGDDVDPAFVRRIGDVKEERYRALVNESTIEPLPGAAEWVRALAETGWRQAVASSAPKLNVQVVVKAIGLREYFAALVAAEDVTHGKPAPDVFLTAASRLGAAPEDCIVVEDAAAGIEAARRAGMASIGIGPAGFGPANLIVPSLTELPAGAFEGLLTRRA